MEQLQLDTVGLSNDEQFSELEIQFIRRHLKDAEEEIGRIDERRHQLTNNIRRYTFAIAPHKKLPEEVIRCIFACFVEDYAIHFPFKKVEKGLTPRQVVLSHVCSAWRQIVLDMKSLWSRITVVPQENFRAFCETWSPRILPRITVDLASSDLEINQLSCREVFLYPFLHFEFKEIEILMNTEQLRSLRQVSNTISLKVEKLGLTIIQWDYERILLPKFLSHPLCSFKIFPEDADDTLDLAMFRLPWAKLQCLDLSDGLVQLSVAIEILRRCTSLEVCSLKLCLASNNGIDDVMPTEPVTHPVLRKLTIHVGRDAKDLCALSHFLLPSLRILEIQGGEWTYDIQEVIRKQLNLDQLHELNIAHVTYSPTVASILEDAPSLRRLSLPPHAMFDKESLRGLGNGELGQHLELLQLYDRSCNVDDIRKMVEARLETRKFIPGIAPLFHVQVTYKIIHDAVQSRFLVVNNGMRIELCYEQVDI
ncbi:hypothetical protein APHAL10511_006853 [Amanita phalloides]|nr:hypothetical protein APHAL10511_006853 [Amanita phalloides]